MFIISFFILLFIEPAVQKLVDPSLYGDTFNVYGFDRVKSNLIIIFFLLLSNLTYGYVNLNLRYKQNILGISLILIFFHIFNILFSIDVTNSLAVATVAILGPLLFFYALLKIPDHVFCSYRDILFITHSLVIVFLSIGLVMYFYNIGEAGGGVEYKRSGGGIWMSNISTQILVPFFPFIFTAHDFKFKRTFKVVTSVLFVVLLIVSMSRTALVVYTLMMLMIFWKKRDKIKWILFSVLGAVIVIASLNYFLNVQVVDMFEDRFLAEGDLVTTTRGNTRFDIYKESIKAFFNNPILGSGIGSFNKISSDGYSNSHNIFINIIVERGIIGIILLFLFIKYFLKLNRLGTQLATEPFSELFRMIKIGFLGFFLIGLTGNDFFISSGFVIGWPMYILVFLLVIQIKLVNKYQNIKKLNTLGRPFL